MRVWLRIPAELEPVPYTRGTTQLAMPHDYSAIEEARENAARALYDQHVRYERDRQIEKQYAADVKERGVGPFYGWKQPGTAYEPR
jgi:hypothetical protein